MKNQLFSSIVVLAGCTAPFVFGCSAEAPTPFNSAGTGNSAGGSTSTGGATAVGGVVAAGGVTSTGGATSAGGATGTSTGGATGTSTGGATSTSTGGATSTSTGGATSTSTGGATSTSTGGATNRGGTGGVGTGGATNAGASGGGAKSTGGATSTGGSVGTGGSAGGSNLAKFSFFVVSYAALTKLSGSSDGFGGDLRYGETGDGAGLRGADKICTTVAETAMPGSGAKVWHAFLSTPTVSAIDRIGNGPWYDRLGRLFSASKANLNGFRPSDADAIIKNDFPNENGVNNHNPDGTGQVDNHDMLTGSGSDGKVYAGTTNPTCDGWTNKTGSAGKPRVGHAWPRTPSAANTCTGGGGPGGGGANAGCYGHWMSSLDEAGCAPGASLIEMGPPNPNNPTVGSGGGYGGFYCFALSP